MSVRLEIVWDGTVPGLTEHRLSLDAFGPALKELLSAVRRIASDLEMQARGPGGGGRGRLARQASNLDIQIETVQGNSPVRLAASVVPIEAPDRPLIDDLPERALDMFIDDLQREARGIPAHYRVRRFLEVLPKGLTQQTYVALNHDGAVRRSADIGAVTIADPRRAPHLVELEGVVVGVGFEPGRNEVKVRAASGELMTFSASESLVGRALELRLQHVNVLAVHDESTRVRLLRVATTEKRPPTPDQRLEAIVAKWGGLLTRLAR